MAEAIRQEHGADPPLFGRRFETGKPHTPAEYREQASVAPACHSPLVEALRERTSFATALSVTSLNRAAFPKARAVSIAP